MFMILTFPTFKVYSSTKSNMKKIKPKWVYVLFCVLYLITLNIDYVQCEKLSRISLGVVSMTNQSSRYDTDYFEFLSPYENDLNRRKRYSDSYSTISAVSNSPARLLYSSDIHVQENHKPVFANCSDYNPTVKEELKEEEFVIQVVAKDQDPIDQGGNITYKFVTAPTEKRKFNIDEFTGRITTEHVFDRDEPVREKETYITVQATDNGVPNLSDVCTIKVIIEDINDNPPVFDKVAYFEYVSEDLKLNHEAMRISATDIDDGNNSIVSYKLENRNPDDSTYFKIDESSGEITLIKLIDKPPDYQFKMKATARDHGDSPLYSEIDIDIVVVSSNKKAPSFINTPKGPIIISEDYSDFEKPITRIEASSNIENQSQLIFELVTGRTDQTNRYNTFSIESKNNTAYIKLAKHLDYETVTEYNLTLRVQNNDLLAAETLITVKVKDVNDNQPAFTEHPSGSVPEDEPIGTPVMQVRAIDPDGTSENNQVEYELDDHKEQFHIDRITGNITTREKFDREHISVYYVKVIAKDNSPSSLYKNGEPNRVEQKFRIEISDKNDNKPNFTQRVYVAESIKEDANINEFVINVKAIDKDTASPVMYSIIGGNTNDSFSIESTVGRIRVKNKLDYETWTNYTLVVRAFDGVFEDKCKVEVKIANVNDNPPQLIDFHNSAEIEEESTPDYCIVTIKAFDPDISNRSLPQHIEYFLPELKDQEHFTIYNNGCLKVTKSLDRDRPFTPQTQLIISLADDDGSLVSLKTTVVFHVNLTDINDNAPILNITQPVVWYENQPPGVVTTLSATDIDDVNNGPPFTYALASNSTKNIVDKFSIEGTELKALTQFDREEQKIYYVPIAITDSGEPKQTGISTLEIIIGDRNDNPMKPGSSEIFVYNYKGITGNVQIGRVYVDDPDDWDLPDKRFHWADTEHEKFSLDSQTGMITMKNGTIDKVYSLDFRVTEEAKDIRKHSVNAKVNVTVKTIPEEAVDKSGSIRFFGINDEKFVGVSNPGESSKKNMLQTQIARLLNISDDNVDVFTVLHSSVSSNKELLDVRFSAHGSPYYSPEKLNTLMNEHKEELEKNLDVQIFMINIDECIEEGKNCESSCVNILHKNDTPYAVFTNKTSFVGVNAEIKPNCQCSLSILDKCLNNGTRTQNGTCQCPAGFNGPNCEITSIAFSGDGWAMYPPLDACTDLVISLDIKPYKKNGLIMYFGPVTYNPLLPIQDFLSLELLNGYPVLRVNYGTGSVVIQRQVINVVDDHTHNIIITLAQSAIEMVIDNCRSSGCNLQGHPVGKNKFLNVNSPLQLGGSAFKLAKIAKAFGWNSTPTDIGFSGCISNLTINFNKTYNLGQPAFHSKIKQCEDNTGTAASFSIHSNFIVALLVCIALLIILLLAVVVHKKRQDPYNEKDMDDIRETIINYEDEGGGEVDTSYDLDVFPKHILPHIGNGIDKAPRPDDVPDICGFLSNKKQACDKDYDTNPFDDVRHYAYEGDGDTSGSLSSLASCTDDGDLKFNYLSNFGPRFRKLADMYGEESSDDDSHEAGEESWC